MRLATGYSSCRSLLQMKGLGLLGVETGDVCAEGGEFFDDAFVAAIDVIDAINDGLAGSDESGDRKSTRLNSSHRL